MNEHKSGDLQAINTLIYNEWKKRINEVIK